MVAARLPTPESLEKRILALLPPDGTPVLNRVMRVMLCRELEQAIGQELYFAARDRLFHAGKIGRLRGQGGQIFLTAAPPSEPARTRREFIETWPEAELMEPLGEYLSGAFRQGLDLPKDEERGLCIVRDTSLIGPLKGQWARPDFVLVSAMRFRLVPGAQVDVHSFELKTEAGGTVQAIHEALAQTRFTHFGHLVWHLPERSKAEARLPEMEKHCEEHGIGLIRMPDPKRPEACEILVDPARKPTAPAAVEGFLESRLTEAQRQRLAAMVNGGR